MKLSPGFEDKEINSDSEVPRYMKVIITNLKEAKIEIKE